ncbi:hypothetical protein VB776_04485 [Arcicella sp. DC2W]|uniref:Uncharacterized protein n=1 Tax=Arcicella gelida TaxID=2984195 RepID=A0ABU5S159_9BACT|nr:hypothetical protein [Arcicella sp. DC2W]MEA5402155.1 hypothetical protein [Arcicella sp. DC2W]
MENIKIGSVVYWNKNGARVYWRPDLNDPVDFLSEEFLEGTRDDGHPYSEKFAYDVPHEGQPINPSIIDTVAGSVTGVIQYKNGIGFYPLRFPFTFYNLDGKNHDDSSKTLKVYVNAEDISMDTAQSKTDKENKELIDSVLNDNPDKLGVAQNDNGSKGSKIPWLTIAIILAVVVFAFLTFWYINKSKSRNLQAGITVPPNRIVSV